MVSTAPNMGNRLTKATIDEAIESLKEEVGPVSESIIVAYVEAPTRTIGKKSASDLLNLFNVEAKWMKQKDADRATPPATRSKNSEKSIPMAIPSQTSK